MEQVLETYSNKIEKSDKRQSAKILLTRLETVFFLILILPVTVYWMFRAVKIKKSKKLYDEGKLTNKIYIRKCELKIINDKEIVKDFLLENHMYGVFIVLFLMFGYKKHSVYGSYFQGQLVYIGCFKKNRKAGEYECYALCSKKGTVVTGAISKIVKTFIGEHENCMVKTWSIGQGQSYERCGFTCIRQSGPLSVVFHNHKPNRKQNDFSLWAYNADSFDGICTA